MLNHYILISSCGYTVIEVKVWLGLGTWISWLGLESNVLGFAALFAKSLTILLQVRKSAHIQ